MEDVAPPIISVVRCRFKDLWPSTLLAAPGCVLVASACAGNGDSGGGVAGGGNGGGGGIRVASGIIHGL